MSCVRDMFNTMIELSVQSPGQAYGSSVGRIAKINIPEEGTPSTCGWMRAPVDVREVERMRQST